ncbi:MAG: hypothetical protein ACOH5I_26290 [Oligoflexus sp.]
MKLLILVIAIAMFGCQSDSDEGVHNSGTCNAAVGDELEVSKDDTTNNSAITNISLNVNEVAVSFDKTSPSSLNWRIRDEKIFFDDGEYQILYDYEAQNWDILDENGAEVGSLTPYRTVNCKTVSRLKLSIFSPKEEAFAYISYLSM